MHRAAGVGHGLLVIVTVAACGGREIVYARRGTDDAGAGGSPHRLDASTATGGSSPGGRSASGGSAACEAGTERCACRPDSACNAGLTCASRLCVNLNGVGHGPIDEGDASAAGGMTGWDAMAPSGENLDAALDHATGPKCRTGKDCPTAFCSSGVCAFASSCRELISRDPSLPDGSYAIAVQGTDARAPLSVNCDMTTLSGGWTKLNAPYAAVLDQTSMKQYLYRYAGRWYTSPPTTIAWSWDSGVELVGDYQYFDGVSVAVIECSGSGEKPLFGVGCSNGPGPTAKVLPDYAASEADGSCMICQDIPDAFGAAVCQGGVEVFVR